MKSIVAANRDYESWLATLVPVVHADLQLKHARMRKSRFAFLRATYFRWAVQWPAQCPELAAAPNLLAIGDLHVENFGTWRDARGRLVWGINDVDEAHRAAYANDLVRLVTSAFAARAEGELRLGEDEIAAAVVAGYRGALDRRPAAFLIAGGNDWLGELLALRKRNAKAFWTKLAAGELVRPGDVPRAAALALARSLPVAITEATMHRRRSGLGSLGRPRFVALARVDGAMLAREAKPTLPSAGAWALGLAPTSLRPAMSLAKAGASPDPTRKIARGWLVRRLAPDCVRVELDAIPSKRHDARLLTAMGAACAILHRASGRAIPAILAHLDAQPAGWVAAAGRQMLAVVDADWQAWRRAD